MHAVHVLSCWCQPKSNTQHAVQGLGLPGLSEQRVVPPFFNMVRTGLLDSPVFSIWLNANLSGSSHPAGELLFGGVDKRRYTGQMHHHPVVSSRCDSAPTVGLRVGHPKAHAWYLG